VCGIDIGKAGLVATIQVPSDKGPGAAGAGTRSFGMRVITRTGPAGRFFFTNPGSIWVVTLLPGGDSVSSRILGSGPYLPR
jgi:hypothetical protein